MISLAQCYTIAKRYAGSLLESDGNYNKGIFWSSVSDIEMSAEGRIGTKAVFL